MVSSNVGAETEFGRNTPIADATPSVDKDIVTLNSRRVAVGETAAARKSVAHVSGEPRPCCTLFIHRSLVRQEVPFPAPNRVPTRSGLFEDSRLQSWPARVEFGHG